MNPNPSETIPAEKIFDAVPLPCTIKHRQILERWHALPVGDYFVLQNDHDPVPLFYQFSAQFEGCFTWDYLERGPEVFAVRIGRVRAAPAAAPGGQP
jgi:uncharacterized protein (DUF2249 family)